MAKKGCGPKVFLSLSIFKTLPSNDRLIWQGEDSSKFKACLNASLPSQYLNFVWQDYNGATESMKQFDEQILYYRKKKIVILDIHKFQQPVCPQIRITFSRFLEAMLR